MYTREFFNFLSACELLPAVHHLICEGNTIHNKQSKGGGYISYGKIMILITIVGEPVHNNKYYTMADSLH